ncbi:hypothetical protein B0H17DRAFT_1301747 [Mycena rosella]|uniref:Uncharacterized protein n=1 Tax=Mycena rosella TaxID=1033263 RepID=A0AAD7GT71_MYCRO|nr:hypothetical protein B0H17DRAFT_1301747 [Mycena rosella]
MDFMLYEPFDFSSSRYASPSSLLPPSGANAPPSTRIGTTFPDYKVARPKRYSRRSARATSISISFVDNPSSSRPFLIPPIFRRREEECLFCNGERFQIHRNVPTSSPFPANVPVKDNLRISSPPPLPTPMELDVNESASIYPPMEQDSAPPATPAPGTWESLCAASRPAKYDDLAYAKTPAEHTKTDAERAKGAAKRAAVIDDIFSLLKLQVVELRSKGKGKERDAGAEAPASASTSTSVGTGRRELTAARAIFTIVSKVSTRSSGSSKKKPIEKADGKKPAGKSRPVKTATGHGKRTALANLSNVHHPPRAPSASVASPPVKTSAPNYLISSFHLDGSVSYVSYFPSFHPRAPIRRPQDPPRSPTCIIRIGPKCPDSLLAWASCIKSGPRRRGCLLPSTPSCTLDGGLRRRVYLLKVRRGCAPHVLYPPATFAPWYVSIRTQGRSLDLPSFSDPLPRLLPALPASDHGLVLAHRPPVLPGLVQPSPLPLLAACDTPPPPTFDSLQPLPHPVGLPPPIYRSLCKRFVFVEIAILMILLVAVAFHHTVITPVVYATLPSDSTSPTPAPVTASAEITLPQDAHQGPKPVFFPTVSIACVAPVLFPRPSTNSCPLDNCITPPSPLDHCINSLSRSRSRFAPGFGCFRFFLLFGIRFRSVSLLLYPRKHCRSLTPRFRPDSCSLVFCRIMAFKLFCKTATALANRIAITLFSRFGDLQAPHVCKSRDCPKRNSVTRCLRQVRVCSYQSPRADAASTSSTGVPRPTLSKFFRLWAFHGLFNSTATTQQAESKMRKNPKMPQNENAIDNPKQIKNEEALNDLKRTKSAVLRQLNDLRDPVSRLPPEIASEIFKRYLPSSPSPPTLWKPEAINWCERDCLIASGTRLIRGRKYDKNAQATRKMYGYIASLLTPAFRFISSSVLRVASTSASSHPAPVHICYSRPSCVAHTSCGCDRARRSCAGYSGLQSRAPPFSDPCHLPSESARRPQYSAPGAMCARPSGSRACGHPGAFAGRGACAASRQWDGSCGAVGLVHAEHPLELRGNPSSLRPQSQRASYPANPPSIPRPCGLRRRPILPVSSTGRCAEARTRDTRSSRRGRPQTPRPPARRADSALYSAPFPPFPAPSTRTPEQPSTILAPLPAAPGGAVQVPPLRCPRHVKSRVGPNSPMRGTHPCPRRLSKRRSAECRVLAQGARILARGGDGKSLRMQPAARTPSRAAATSQHRNSAAVPRVLWQTPRSSAHSAPKAYPRMRRRTQLKFPAKTSTRLPAAAPFPHALAFRPHLRTAHRVTARPFPVKARGSDWMQRRLGDVCARDSDEWRASGRGFKARKEGVLRKVSETSWEPVNTMSNHNCIQIEDLPIANSAKLEISGCGRASREVSLVT